MAWPPGKHFETLIAHAYQVLTDVRLIRYDIGLSRALLDLEGRYGNYRIIVSEIHRIDNSVRYAYYVLDENGQVERGFDNSPDVMVAKLHFSGEWKAHLSAEIPHQHDHDQNLTLTEPMTFNLFINWLASQTQIKD